MAIYFTLKVQKFSLSQTVEITVQAIWIILHLMQQQIILQCTKRIEIFLAYQ